jgi:hypothetical protein
MYEILVVGLETLRRGAQEKSRREGCPELTDIGRRSLGQNKRRDRRQECDQCLKEIGDKNTCGRRPTRDDINGDQRSQQTGRAENKPSKFVRRAQQRPQTRFSLCLVQLLNNHRCGL